MINETWEPSPRMRRIVGIWSWLPAFRASAESSHLPSAAKLLGVTPPALSRTLRLIEDAVGFSLFDRVGRKIVLNERGEQLLTAVRTAMRLVDDALDEILGNELHGSIRIAAMTHHSQLVVVPAIAALRQLHPKLSVSVLDIAPENMPTKLQEGTIDIAVMPHVPQSKELICEPLKNVRYGVYRRSAGKKRAVDIQAKEFVAAGPSGFDRWPEFLPRSVSTRVSSFAEALELCCQTKLRVVLPEFLAERSPIKLSRQAMAIPDEKLFVVYRAPVGRHPRMVAFLGALGIATKGPD